MQPERFVVTTNSNHKLEIYLNLASRMKLTGINQLWVADITYIRLKAEFVYLAVILDGFSRKVVGWALDRTLAIRLTIGAMEQAIERRQPEPGLVHHSDRGLQYASAEYAAILEKHRMVPSMSRPANPYDNASCESFMKTLKREEIYANKYDDLENLRANIQEFIEQYYNRQRLHSALGYRSPEEFEQQIEASGSTESRSATMVFFENKQNDERGSTRLLGKETQMPSPSPDPFSCQKMQKRCYESGSCVQKKLCHSNGSPQNSGSTLSHPCVSPSASRRTPSGFLPFVASTMVPVTEMHCCFTMRRCEW